MLLARMRRAGGQPIRPGAPAAVYEPAALKLRKGRGVVFAPLALGEALVLWPARIPVEAEPAQVLRHELRIVHIAALGIEILQPEDKLAAGMPRVQPGQEAGADVAQMQPPARAGRVAASFDIAHFHHR